MESEIIKMAFSYGIFAVLFCFLLFYVLRENAVREAKMSAENATREAKYQEIISQLTEKFGKLETGLEILCKDVGDIKEKIFK